MTRAALVSALVLGLASPAAAQLTDRPRYVGALLSATRAMPAQARLALVRQLRVGVRGKCRAGFTTPDVRCVVDVARAACTDASSAKQCRLVTDVALTNFLAEKEWVDKKTRVDIMNNSDDFQTGMRAELRKRYAVLVAELTMMRGFDAGPGLPGAIDRFCVARSRRSVLSWSRCVAAVVWYIATSPRGKRRQPSRD